MLVPLGHRLLIKPEKIEEIDAAYKSARNVGIVIPEMEARKEQVAVDRGTVVALGSTAFVDFGGVPWAAIGDKVAYTRYGGKLLKDSDGEEYIILNDEDIICKFA
jgi:co-chaperonin GroES (HSP10)